MTDIEALAEKVRRREDRVLVESGIRNVDDDVGEDPGDPWQDDWPTEAPSSPIPSSTTKVEPKPRYHVLGPEEIYAPLPPPDYAIGGLLRRANLALIVAYGSSLKTWAAVDALVATGTGGMFLGRFPCASPVEALFIDWESGNEELRRRIQLVSRARGLPFPVAGVHMITMPDLFFTSGDFEAELEKLAERFGVIIFDSLAAGSCDVDENDARFAKGLQVCRRVAERKQTSVIVLHHSRKDGGADDQDERQSVRGSGAIFAAADVCLSLRRKKGHDDDVFVVKQTKARGGKRIEPFVLKVEDTPAGDVRVYATDLDDEDDGDVAGTSNAIDKTKTAILALLTTNHDLRSGNEICRRLKGAKVGGRNVVLAALKELHERDTITTFDHCLRITKEVRP